MIDRLAFSANPLDPASGAKLCTSCRRVRLGSDWTDDRGAYQGSALVCRPCSGRPPAAGSRHAGGAAPSSPPVEV